jgi:hypothetical protein
VGRLTGLRSLDRPFLDGSGDLSLEDRPRRFGDLSFDLSRLVGDRSLDGSRLTDPAAAGAALDEDGGGVLALPTAGGDLSLRAGGGDRSLDRCLTNGGEGLFRLNLLSLGERESARETGDLLLRKGERERRRGGGDLLLLLSRGDEIERLRRGGGERDLRLPAGGGLRRPGT